MAQQAPLSSTLSHWVQHLVRSAKVTIIFRLRAIKNRFFAFLIENIWLLRRKGVILHRDSD
jgi:hypothetical protein